MTPDTETLWLSVDPAAFPSDARLAPPGTIWVCAACGKTSRDRFNGPGMWDEACMLNSVLCHEPRGSNGHA